MLKKEMCKDFKKSQKLIMLYEYCQGCFCTSMNMADGVIMNQF